MGKQKISFFSRERLAGKTQICISTIILFILGCLATLWITDSWSYIRYFLPPLKSGELSVTIGNFQIIRENNTEFPVCNIQIVAENSMESEQHIKLNSISMFQETLKYDFGLQDSIYIDIPVGGMTHNIEFSDNCLDKALKIPLYGQNLKIWLEYTDVKSNDKDTIVVSVEDIIKCTYWQAPVFVSEKEAEKWELQLVYIKLFSTFTDTLTEAKTKYIHNVRLFMDSVSLETFNIKYLSDFIETGRMWDIDTRVWKRRIGGSYFGFLKEEVDASFLRSPKEALINMNSYDRDELFGFDLNIDFSKTQEFIHISYDSSKREGVFSDYQENTKYQIVIFYEDSTGIQEIETSLQSKGYGVRVIKDTLLLGFSSHLGDIALADTSRKFQKLINDNVSIINNAIATNRTIFLINGLADSIIIAPILDDFNLASRSSKSTIIGFSKRLLGTGNQTKPFATEIIITYNYGEETRGLVFDSLAVVGQ